MAQINEATLLFESGLRETRNAELVSMRLGKKVADLGKRQVPGRRYERPFSCVLFLIRRLSDHVVGWKTTERTRESFIDGRFVDVDEFLKRVYMYCLCRVKRDIDDAEQYRKACSDWEALQAEPDDIN